MELYISAVEFFVFFLCCHYENQLTSLSPCPEKVFPKYSQYANGLIG